MMTQINFLPESYFKERRRQRRVMRETMLVAVVGALIIVWYLGTRTRVVALEQLVSSRQQEIQSIQSQQSEMVKLDKERSVLLHQVQLERELSQPINHTAVVATLATLMPQSMALTDMSIQTPAPVPSGKGVKRDNPQSRASLQGNVPVMRVSMVGLAPRDMEIADFMSRLTEHPLFMNVKMSFSRSVELMDKHVMAREFRVEMEIRLDRIYQAPSRAVMEGVAHVD